jgi:DNA anti-recombination protein RmuC
MKLSKLAVSLYALLIFASGIAIGAVAYRLYTVNTVNANAARNPEEWRKRYTHEMQTRLHLDQDQLRKLNEILDETRVRFTEVRERMKPELERIRSEQTDKVRAMLNDSQRQEYEKMRREREEHEKAHNKPGHPGM